MKAAADEPAQTVASPERAKTFTTISGRPIERLYTAESVKGIDYAFFAYYVEAQLRKTNATANPGLMSVQICPSQDACDP